MNKVDMYRSIVGIRYGQSVFFFSSRRRYTRYWSDWSSDVCSSDLRLRPVVPGSHRKPWVREDDRGRGSGAGWEGGWGPDPSSAPPGLRSVHSRDRRETRWTRSEERRVGKESRSRWSPYH